MLQSREFSGRIEADEIADEILRFVQDDGVAFARGLSYNEATGQPRLAVRR